MPTTSVPHSSILSRVAFSPGRESHHRPSNVAIRRTRSRNDVDLGFTRQTPHGHLYQSVGRSVAAMGTDLVSEPVRTYGFRSVLILTKMVRTVYFI